MKSLAVFVSGRGSNLNSICKACEDGGLSAFVSVVVSNKENAPAEEIAKKYKIPYLLIPHKDYEDKSQHEKVIIEKLSKYNFDLICLAGYMRILSPYFIDKINLPILNIHPSLLPKYKGLDTHKKAIENGDEVAGCTVHYVNNDLDGGDIILQKSVSIDKGETEESLAEKVLKEEHILYPKAIQKIL